MPSDKRDKVLETYEAEHRHPVNRALHAVGIPVIILSTAALILPGQPFRLSRKASLAGLAAGCGLLLAGHAVEGKLVGQAEQMRGALAGLHVLECDIVDRL